MWYSRTDDAQPVPARIGGLGVYATAAELHAWRRSRGERVTLTIITVAGCWTIAPLAFFIPPHFESVIVALLLGLYFGRRAWVGEWQISDMGGTCPRCEHAIGLKRGTMLYLPHTLHCGGCKAELWLELEPAPEVPPEIRSAARRQARDRAVPLAGRLLTTWSPAGSDWRDRPRTPE
jgi:hypothetical protein